MVKMEGFGKTWLSGLLMIAAVGLANWLLSYLNVASLHEFGYSAAGFNRNFGACTFICCPLDLWKYSKNNI